MVRFAFDKNGYLYHASSKGDATKYSQYYTDKLVEGIGAKETIDIEINATPNKVGLDSDGSIVRDFKADGVNTEQVNLDTRKYGDGVTWGQQGTDQLVVISGNDWSLEKDTSGKPLLQTVADILLHELLGHAIPLIVGSDTGNAVDNENKARNQLKQLLRQASPDHRE